MLDAFTDSDFRLGGTNTQGWILGGAYGLTDNTYLTARYMSAEEIDRPALGSGRARLGIDVLQLDLNSRF